MSYNPFDNLQINKNESYDVRKFFDDHQKKHQLELVTKPETLRTSIIDQDLNRPGLALAGFMDIYSNDRIQVIGTTEWSYLESVGSDKRKEIVASLFSQPSPLWIVTNGLPVHDELLDMAKKNNIPVMTTNKETMNFYHEVQLSLEAWFSPYAKIHASLVEVHGIGMLYIGMSNIGKSECVLDLISRGHRLVGDDGVRLSRKGDSIIGRRDHILTTHMEIRGLGFLDVQKMYGVRAVRKYKKVDVIVELQQWDSGQTYDRLGLDSIYQDVFGCKIRKVLLPVSPGRNIATVSEVIALETVIRLEDKVFMATDFNKNVIKKIQKKMKNNFKDD